MNSFPLLLRLPLSVLLLLLLKVVSVSASAEFMTAGPWEFPTNITLRVGVLHAPPFAILKEQPDGSIHYSGFQPDLLERLKIFAQQDGVALDFIMSPSPPNFNPALDLVANDCNTTKNPNTLEDCNKFDAIVANYYATPARCTRVALSPPWLKSTITTLKYLDKPPGAEDYTTLKQAEDAGAPICVKGGTFFATVVKGKFPNGVYVDCPTLEECIATLKRGECVLSAEDELMSRYSQAWDVSLEVTREQFNTQYKVWPFSYKLPFETRLLMEKWLRDANTNATLDELYSVYFQKSLCPVGTAGENCELPCDPIHGTSNKRGVCVCESTKWTGDDCSIEVEEELNLIPQYMIFIAYSMLGINVFVIVVCAIWLFWQRNSTQVRVSQPFFLALVLVGCLISSSTILVLGQEDEGDGPVPACMAIPWLYSIGFSITFGTLFAKIRRVYLIFKSAAEANQRGSSGMQRSNAITAEETLGIIGVVLLIDCVILIAWTLMDPLHWERYVISADQFGEPLESEGRCVSDNWLAYGGALALLHLVLLGTACCLCYVARDIPTRFSEGKYVSIAMISNLQIFIVGVPILIIIGTEPATSFFVRCTIIWMNDLAVVVLLFGNLIYSTHFAPNAKKDDVKKAVAKLAERQSKHHRSQFGSTSHALHDFSSDGANNNPNDFGSGHDSLLSSNHQKHQPKKTRKPAGHSVQFADQAIPEKRQSGASVASSKKPVDVLRNSSVGGSWGGANLSTFAPQSHHDNDDDDIDENVVTSEFDDETVDDESDEVLPMSQKFEKPVDVLANNKDSWAGGALSQIETPSSSTRTAPLSSSLHNSNHHTGPAAASTGGGSNNNHNHNKNSGNVHPTTTTTTISGSTSSLPPAKLPKNKPTHMSYAESRISKLRGQHAQYIQEKRNSKNSTSNKYAAYMS